MLALTNGRIFTGRGWATGLVIADDGTVAGVLSSDSVSTGVRARDLEGRMVVPGFIDAHLHLSHMAEARRGLPIRGDESPAELLAMVSRRAREIPSSSWILGIGYDDTGWPPGAIDRWTLDAVSPHHPVFLERKDLHSGVANSLALQLAEIVESITDPPAGRFERDAKGRLTGVLKESARGALHQLVPSMQIPELKVGLEKTCYQLLALGVTTVCSIGDDREVVALQLLVQEGRLPLRVCQYVTTSMLRRFPLEGLQSAGSGLSSDYWLAGVKLFADGSLGSRTAWLEEPYTGTNDYGVPVMEPGELKAAVEAARGVGLAVAIHAIGDRALRVALDAIEAAPPSSGASGFPDRIEHVQLGSPALFDRMRKLRVVASMQPAHAPADRILADRWWGSRCRYAYAWRSVLDAGVRLAFGSDAPVESPDPLPGVWAACTRQDAGGVPVGGWYPEQRVSLEEALAAYTSGAALAVGRPRTLGNLAVGSPGDLVVLEGEPGKGQTRVLETFIAGRPVTGG